MSDLNDLSRPVTTDTEPNVLDTIRAHLVRAATWSGWGATANKVAGIMSAVTAAVTGGRSLRLYRRNDLNTADEEVVLLPAMSVGGNAATASAAQSGSALETLLATKAALNSPSFTGTPTVPTAAAGTNTTQIASTAFVHTEIANVVGSTPAALDTLNELATALGNDANFATTMTNALAGKAPSSHIGATGAAHGVATNSVAGFMSATDKAKLDGIAAGAQTNAVTSVAGKTGAVSVSAADVGLGNVNNTADANKSVNYASSAGAVPWSGVSGKPTAVSAFSNDVGYITNAAISGGSISGNGWKSLGGGLIMQWGVKSVSPGNNSITFPVAFPNACLTVVNSAYLAFYYVGLISFSNTGCVVYGNNPFSQTWIAIGY